MRSAFGALLPESKSCECEHAAHLYAGELTPHGNPGHKYMQRFMQLAPVKTAYGTFRVCPDCAKDCLAYSRTD